MEAGFSVNEALSLCTVKEGGNPFKTQNQIALPVSMAMTFAVGQSRMAFFLGRRLCWVVSPPYWVIHRVNIKQYNTITFLLPPLLLLVSRYEDTIFSFCWLVGMCIHFVEISPNDEGDEGIKNYNIRGIKGKNKTDG